MSGFQSLPSRHSNPRGPTCSSGVSRTADTGPFLRRRSPGPGRSPCRSRATPRSRARRHQASPPCGVASPERRSPPGRPPPPRRTSRCDAPDGAAGLVQLGRRRAAAGEGSLQIHAQHVVPHLVGERIDVGMRDQKVSCSGRTPRRQAATWCPWCDHARRFRWRQAPAGRALPSRL